MREEKVRAESRRFFYYGLYEDYGLYEAARSVLSVMLGGRGQANKKLDDKSGVGQVGERVLRIFETGSANTSAPQEETNPAGGSASQEWASEPAIKNLNEGWNACLPSKVLNKYTKIIKRASGGKRVREKLPGLCTVATIEYLLGDLREASVLAHENWKDAEDQTEDDYVLKWMASYAYFGSTSFFLGDFDKAIELMATHWNEHRAREDREEREKKIADLSKSYVLTINPISTIPRYLILAAAFNGSPTHKKQYWPNEARTEERTERRTLNRIISNELRSELKWVERWYEEAKDISADDRISLDLSHAYVGFYFTLLYLASQDAGRHVPRSDSRKRVEGVLLRKKAKDALDRIGREEEPPVVSLYVKSGFYGIYKLVTEDDPEEALTCFREAARYSAVHPTISGIRFSIGDFLFMCCHAVAAQRVERDRKSKVHLRLKPEVDYYLKQARDVAEKLEHSFYFDLYEAVCSEVSRMRGEKGWAEKYEARTEVSQARKRILRIFRADPATASVQHRV